MSTRVVMVLGRSTGGIGTHVADLAEGLTVRGCDVAVITDQLTAGRFDLPNVRAWWPMPGHPLRAVRDLAGARRLVRGSGVVHAHGHQAGVLAVVLARTVRHGPAVIVSLHNAVLHGTGWRRRVLEGVQSLVARSADLVTGASADLVDQAAVLGARWTELAPVTAPRVEELLAQEMPTARERRRAATDLMRSHGITGDLPLVVTISRIAPQKDLDTLLRAAAALDVPVAWCVLGDGDDVLRERLAAEIRRRDLPVHLVGAVDDPGAWLRAADVCVLTSTWEARALVVQEALAAGTPVVCSRTGGLPELVEGVGHLVAVGDDAAFAAAVAALLRDTHQRHTLATAGRDRAATWPDRDDTARRWVQWYDRARSMT